ncbi:AfsR/SARP family transcriptional regulator [Nakamurella endophytica]|uniref:AfsR/SARP family transcriptional regulator n=1 Tax=Nakamurella endophytica TaxID=1748367 RepID=UPI00166D5A59|nr:BTAD domain-containing putative transcriptional regulator [Nakamurella endophytica]
MQFRDLGPLRVESDGVPLRIAGRRLSTLLAVLVAHAGDAVPVDRLVEATWTGSPPVRAEAALDSLLWRLRRILDPDREARGPGEVLRTEPGGYRIVAGDREVDSRAFAAGAAGSASALRAGDPGAALEAADRALERWRGVPFDGIADAPWVASVRHRMDSVRLDVRETRIQALLDLGRPEQAASDVLPLLRDHPFRERLWAQRMLGLYRAGRQADALATFADARALLAAELGVRPGPELTGVHAAVLAQDPVLQGSGAQAVASGGGLAGPVRLPPRVAGCGAATTISRTSTTCWTGSRS